MKSKMPLSSWLTFTGTRSISPKFAHFHTLRTAPPADTSMCPRMQSCMQVATSADASKALGSSVRQAFLPKFENEDRDTSIADSIVEQVGACVKICVIDFRKVPA